MHPSRMTFRMSKDQPGSRKKPLGACPSPARVGSSSSSQSDVPIPCNFEAWISSDFFFNLPNRTRASSWDESEEDSSPVTENVPNSRRLYSAGSKKSQESISSEIDELKKEFFQSLENSRDGDNKLRYEVIDRRQSPARIRRRTRSSSSSSPVPEIMNESSEDKNFQDETENKMLELDSKMYLNNFFTELRSRRISLFDSSLIEDIAQKSSDPNDDGYCRTSRKLSQILEVEEARRDPERNFEESTKEKSRKSDALQEEQERHPEYRSLSLERLERGNEVSKGSLSERCDRVFRQVNQDGIHLTAKTAKTRLGSPKWYGTSSTNETFLERLKLNGEESAETLEEIEVKHSPKFRISVGKESGRSLVMEDVNTPDRKTKSEVKTSSSEESSCGKSSSSEETQGVPLESPSLNSSSRTLKLDPLEISQNTPLSASTIKTTQGSRSMRSVKEDRNPSEGSTSRTSITRRITGSRKSTSRPSSTSSEDNQELEGNSGREEEEKKSNHWHSPRSQASDRRSSRKLGPSAVNSPTSAEKGNPLDTVEWKSERTTSDIEEAEREGNDSNRSKTSSGRDGNKRLSIINEVSFEDVEIMNVHLENEPSSDVLGKSGEKCRKDGGMWDDLIEAFDGSQSSSFSRQENFPGFPPRTQSSSRNSTFPSEKDPEKSEEEAFEDDSFMHSRRLAEMEKSLRSPRRNSGKRLQKKQEDLLKDLKDSYLVVEERQEENPRTKEKRPTQHSSTFFFDVTKGTPFCIGEFGDVTCWNVGKPDMVESEKPEDHGDGLKITHSRREAFAFVQEKTEKDTKTKRRQSTELRRDSREAIHLEDEETFFIPSNIKPSKSDNCITFTSEKERSDVSRKRKREPSSMSKSTIQGDSDSETTEERENPGIDRELIRRLSSSMSNINGLLEKDEDVSESRRDLFQKQREEVESTKRQEKKEKTGTKGHNWLILKNPEGKQTKRQKKKSKSRKTPSREYLCQDLAQANVPGLKLRNTNCLQSLYKRVISVFCLTSSSSAATSN